MGAKKLGIIAEDQSDVAVVKVLTERLRGSSIAVKSFVGNGCGRIVGKSEAWSRDLWRAGCNFLLVVHDLDERSYGELEIELNRAIARSPIGRFSIVIPVKEIEAWLLSDELAISKYFNLKKRLKHIANPENVDKPKERLGRLIYQATSGAKRYVNSIHNEKIAKEVTLSKLRRCRSFGRLEDFVKQHLR